eukprot:scaffold319523_cov31-Tisochrysis_lutea.AAC.3
MDKDAGALSRVLLSKSAAATLWLSPLPPAEVPNVLPETSDFSNGRLVLFKSSWVRMLCTSARSKSASELPVEVIRSMFKAPHTTRGGGRPVVARVPSLFASAVSSKSGPFSSCMTSL